MCEGTIHLDWYCCKDFLISKIRDPVLPISLELRSFLQEGRDGLVMNKFKTYPPKHPTPTVVIQVVKETSTTTTSYYFAFDKSSDAWYEIEEDWWLEFRKGMGLESLCQVSCDKEDIAYSFLTWREHPEGHGLKFGAVSESETEKIVSRKDQRKKKVVSGHMMMR